MFPEDLRHVACLYAALCSFPLDYVARQKLGGVSLKYFTMRQITVPPPVVFASFAQWDQSSSLSNWITNRVLQLTYTAWDLQQFAHDCGYSGPPFKWDEQRRFLLRCELDAAFFHLYLGTPEDWANEPQALRASFPESRDAVAYIMDTFPIVRKKDKQQFESYRTKETILEIYDAMAEASRTGLAYRSLLYPPPGDLRACAHQDLMSISGAKRMQPYGLELNAAKIDRIVTPELQNKPEELNVVRPAA
jgi:hypothetical protein